MISSQIRNTNQCLGLISLPTVVGKTLISTYFHFYVQYIMYFQNGYILKVTTAEIGKFCTLNSDKY